MSEAPHVGDTREGQKSPPWSQRLPGLVGGLWLVACIGYVFWAKVLSPGLNILGKALVSAICVSGVAFVISALEPLRARPDGRPGAAVDWTFLRGAAPADPNDRAVWRKFRRTMAILAVTAVLVIAWVVFISLGLAKTG